MGTNLTGCYPSDFCASGAHECSEGANCVYLGPGQYRCEVSLPLQCEIYVCLHFLNR